MNGTILLVDDNRAVRQFCKSELEAAGYSVLLAHDAEDAMFVCSQTVPDLVVTDIHMRFCDGLDLARRLKSTYPALPVVFHTSDDEYQYCPVADGYVRKSEDLDLLKGTISRCLFAPAQRSTLQKQCQ